MGTIEIWNNQINDLLVSTWPAVDDPWIKILLFFDGTLHGSQCELLFLVVRIPTDLDPDGADEAGVKNLELGVLLVDQLALVHQFRKGNRSTGLTTADHGFVQDQSRSLDWPLIIKGALYSLDEIDLTVVGLDVQSREKLVVVRVINQFRVLYHQHLVVVLVILLQPFYAVFQIQDQRRRDLNLLGVVDETLTPKMGVNPDYLDQDVDQLENLGIVYFLIDFVFPDVVCHIEKCH